MISDPEEIDALYRKALDEAHRAYLKERLTPTTDACSRAWRKVWEDGFAHAHQVALQAVFEAGKEYGFGIMSHLS